MKYAKKVQLSVEFPRLKKSLPVIDTHGEDNIGTPHVVRRYMPRNQMELIRDVLPESLKPHLMGVNYTEILLLGPHIHIEEQCVINFYQQVNGEITSFWEGEIEQDDRWTADNGKGYTTVNPDKIKIVESFKAQQNDVWVLSTRQPHSVGIEGDARPHGQQYSPENNNPRWIVQAYMDLPYNDVVEALQHEVAQ
jgi:hypothetical protein